MESLKIFWHSNCNLLILYVWKLFLVHVPTYKLFKPFFFSFSFHFFCLIQPSEHLFLVESCRNIGKLKWIRRLTWELFASCYGWPWANPKWWPWWWKLRRGWNLICFSVIAKYYFNPLLSILRHYAGWNRTFCIELEEISIFTTVRIWYIILQIRPGISCSSIFYYLHYQTSLGQFPNMFAPV